MKSRLAERGRENNMSASSELVMTNSSSVIPSRIAAAGAAAVALVIIGLHALRPEFEPSWRFISEYAIGRHAWIMKGGFLIWALSCAALALALWQKSDPGAARSESASCCCRDGAGWAVPAGSDHRRAG